MQLVPVQIEIHPENHWKTVAKKGLIGLNGPKVWSLYRFVVQKKTINQNAGNQFLLSVNYGTNKTTIFQI